MSHLIIDAEAAANIEGVVSVRIELTDGRGNPVIGFVTGSDDVIIAPSVHRTDANGQLTLEVVPNVDITPGNTAYTVTVGDKSFLISKSGATQNLFESIISDPGDLDPITTGVLLAINNLSDVNSASQSRFNLELGNSATLDVGVGAGFVAAGDDPRFQENADAIQDHIDDPIDAHDASAISVVPFETIAATNVQAALEEVYAEASSPGGPVAAEDVSFVPTGDLTSTDVQAVIVELDGELHAHEADTVDAHDATAISFAPTGNFSSTDVQAAIVEAYSDATVYSDAALNTHLTDPTDAHDASAISNVPAGTIASTDVQAAINELDSDVQSVTAELAAHLADTVDAHDASAISFAPAGDIVATDVQAAIAEVDTEFHAHVANPTGAHAATAISFVPTGDIVATNAQTAIAEVDTELHDHLNDTVDAHDASAISFSPTGTISSTDVQAAIAEVAAEASSANLDTFSWKFPVRVASTANVSTVTAPSAVDGVTLVSGDRILLKDQSTGSQNGIYTFASAGTALTRATDADASSEVKAGLAVISTEGSANADKVWILTTNDPITLGSTSLTFESAYVKTVTTVAGASTDVLTVTIGGESFPRFELKGDGSLAWGTGTATPDRMLEVNTASYGGMSIAKPFTFGVPASTVDGAAPLQFTGTYTDASKVKNVAIGGTTVSPTWSYTGAATTAALDAYLDATMAWGGATTGSVVRQARGLNFDLRITPTGGTYPNFGTANPNMAGAQFQTRTVSPFAATVTSMAGVNVIVRHDAGAGTISGDFVGIQVRPPGFTAGGTVSGTVSGATVYNQGNAAWATSYGIKVEAQSGSTSNNTSLAIGAATHRTLHISDNTNSTTEAGGIVFGSSADTNLYRSAASTLKTDDSFIVGTALTIVGNVGFYNTTPIAKYATTGTFAGFTAGAGTNVTHLSTFTGNTGATAYTIGDVVRALKLYGLLTA